MRSITTAYWFLLLSAHELLLICTVIHWSSLTDRHTCTHTPWSLLRTQSLRGFVAHHHGPHSHLPTRVMFYSGLLCGGWLGPQRLKREVQAQDSLLKPPFPQTGHASLHCSPRQSQIRKPFLRLSYNQHLPLSESFGQTYFPTETTGSLS